MTFDEGPTVHSCTELSSRDEIEAWPRSRRRPDQTRCRPGSVRAAIPKLVSGRMRVELAVELVPGPVLNQGREVNSDPARFQGLIFVPDDPCDM